MNEHPSKLPDAHMNQPHETVADETAAAPTSASRWQHAKFLFRAIEVRLRFILLFVAIALLMVYWRTIENYWDRWTRPLTQTAAAEADTEYYCPMHPSVVRPGLEPNGAVPSCPICGMPLSKRKKGEVPELPAGITARVQLSPERVKLAGVETAEASYMPLMKEIRTVGYVEHDESRYSKIVTRVSGYLERLYVDKIFTTVEKGEPLAEIYSPQLYSSIQELLLAQKHGAADLVASSRRRLKLLGISDAEIDDALAGDETRARLLIRSPQSGHVVEKNVVEGSSVAAGDTLFKVADISRVWIEADVYERDLSFLREGQTVDATVEAYPGKVFQGEISLIYPELNPETRTNRIRATIENPEHLLRPGMFATVTIETPMSETEQFRMRLVSSQQPAGASDEVLSIPARAVIDTGTSQVVYVEREPGLFEGVEVELGPRADGYYPVLSGLSPGDKVAAAGAFLLDAETRLNPAAASSYFGASGSSANGRATGSSRTTASATGGARPKSKTPSASDLENIAKLPAEDRELAIAQGVCPITDEPLGSMGVPIKIMLEGQPVFLCCKGCVKQAQEKPAEILEKIGRLKAEEPRDERKSDKSAAKEYDLTAEVIAIGADQKSVTLDHDDIPGLMPGMTMRFGVASAEVLKGIQPGDKVEGRLTVKSGDYIVTQLKAK